MFSSSSRSSSTVRNVRRTITNHNNHNSLNEPPVEFRALSRGPAFREPDTSRENPVLTAFDNFDHHNENPNLRHLHNNHNELTIETSSRIARPATRANGRNNNNIVTNDRKPPNPIRSVPRAIEPPRNEPRNAPAISRSNDLPDLPVRVNGNIRVNNGPSPPPSQPLPPSGNNPNADLLSNATVTIDSKCLDCICFGRYELIR